MYSETLNNIASYIAAKINQLMNDSELAIANWIGYIPLHATVVCYTLYERKGVCSYW